MSASSAGDAGPVMVCGLGHVGIRIVELLRALGEEVTVVTLEPSSERRRMAEEAGARIVVGDARDLRVLEDAGLGACRALIAATDRDVTNLEIVLDARALCPALPIVARLFDRTLLSELPAALSLRGALAMSALAAPAFAAAALGGTALHVFETAGDHWVVARAGADLPGASPLSLLPERPGAAPEGEAPRLALARKDAWARATRGPAPPARRVDPLRLLLLPVRIVRSAPLPLRVLGGTLLALIVVSAFVFYAGLKLGFLDAVYFLIATVTTTGYGDISLKDASPALKLYGCLVMLFGSAGLATIVSMLTDFTVRLRLRELSGREEVTLSGHVVVVGLGGVGSRVVEELAGSGVPAVAIERDPDAPLLASTRERAPVVLGDGRLPETLGRAGVARAESVVVVTGDDAVNLAVVLAARRLSPGLRTVVRLFDPVFAGKVVAGLKLGAVLSASRLAAPVFVASALYAGVRAAFVEGDMLFVFVDPGDGSGALALRTRPLRRA